MRTLTIIILSVFGLVVSYYFIKPYLKLPGARKVFLRRYLVFLAIVFLVSICVKYFIIDNQPESFKQGVELLKNKKEILNKIGEYDSFTFYQDSLPKGTDNPARFKVALNGSIATIYLECTMQKDKTDKWFLKELKEDSVVKKR